MVSPMKILSVLLPLAACGLVVFLLKRPVAGPERYDLLIENTRLADASILPIHHQFCRFIARRFVIFLMNKSAKSDCRIAKSIESSTILLIFCPLEQNGLRPKS